MSNDFNRADREVELYKLYVQTAESNIDRRLQMHRFFFSVFAGICIAYAFIFERLHASTVTDANAHLGHSVALLLPALAGAISIAWLFITLAFRHLSRVKYKIIAELETEFDISVHRREWEEFKRAHRSGTITQWELLVPLLLFGFSVLVIAVELEPVQGPGWFEQVINLL